MDKKKHIVEAVLKSASIGRESDNKKRLTCAQAFELAKKLDMEIIEIGHICNQHDIKICKCQLGCFA